MCARFYRVIRSPARFGGDYLIQRKGDHWFWGVGSWLEIGRAHTLEHARDFIKEIAEVGNGIHFNRNGEQIDDN